MSIDVTELRAFYASPLGLVARRMIGRHVERFLRQVDGLRLLGLGYSLPYMAAAEACERRLAFMPGLQGAIPWPDRARPTCALVDPLTMPLADGAVDRVLVAHALETVESPSELLHELWRILSPGGRIIMVCPNRRGVWARMDTTPFGQGQPFSRSQLRRLMARTGFEPTAWAEALYVPPIRSRILLSGAAAWERLGVDLSLPFAGLHVVEGTKQMARAIPARARRRARRSSPVLVPAPAPG